MLILPSERPPVIVEFTADSATPLMERFAFSSDPPAGDHAEVSDHSHDEGRTPPSVIRVKSSADAWIAIAAAVAIAEYFNICAIKIFFYYGNESGQAFFRSKKSARRLFRICLKSSFRAFSH